MLASVAEVLINRPSKHLNRTFSYLIPDTLPSADVGYRCVVPFARRMEEGVILSVREEDTEKLGYKLLPIRSLVDPFPWFTPEMIAQATAISKYYMCTLIEALRLFFIDKKGILTEVEYEIAWPLIPEDAELRGLVDASVEVLSEKDAKLLLGELLSSYIEKGWLMRHERLSAVHKEPLEKWLAPLTEPVERQRRRSKKQGELWDILAEKGPISVTEAQAKGFSSSVVKAFCLNDYGRIFYKRKRTYSLIEAMEKRKNRTLTDEQSHAIQAISEAIDKEKYQGMLLKGVTGSGKTEVYLQAAQHALDQGGSALILVPEIALTNQMTAYFAAVFGDEVVFMHSNLSKGERYNNRLRIANGESHIIIGSRSAIFLPFQNLKLIVVDEEYDSSYKQGESPRYNGRDVAKMMSVIYHCPIVLGAATPSIDTYYAAKQGKIQLLEMKKRVFETPLPAIHVFDLRSDPAMAQSGELLSHPLLDLLHKTLEEKHKAILLLNRRGFATTLMCPTCGYVFKCPHCDVSLVYHKDTQQLKCHYCETVHPLPTECPKCHGKKILYLGRGTQRIEEELAEKIPEARCRRFDVDSTAKKNSAKEILTDFRNGEFDILFGTQMVAKGHDIPGVQTVGILAADGVLNMPSYLAAEQTFNLITQCAGRAGRSREQGEVILQTYNPDHYVIQVAAKQDYESFYTQELEYRRLLHFPPFTRMMKITCFNEEEKKAMNQASRIYQWLQKVTPQLPQRVLYTPPYPEPIRKVRNLYYISILIKGNPLTALKNAMRHGEIFQENDIIIDVDPM